MNHKFPSNRPNVSRRKFIQGVTAASVSLGAGSALHGQVALPADAPAIHADSAPGVHTDDKTDKHMIVGEGDYQYQISHDHFQLPDKFHWQVTHNVAVDSQGRVYIIHEGRANLKEHPSIFVFDAAGKYIKSFGQKYQGGGHGLEIKQEGSEEFIYVTTVVGDRVFAKLTLEGEELWERRAPMQALIDGKPIYPEGEDTKSITEWGRRDNYKPTNIAFLDDGEFLVADGYGAYVIHRHDKEGNYVSTMGTMGRNDGQFMLPHGLWIDRRDPEQQKVVITDRSNNRLQWMTIEGEHLKTMGGFLLPANIDIQGDLMLVPELQARITLMDAQDNIVACLGDDAEYRKRLLANKKQMRREPKTWQDGKFLHPHDACFDAEGNIIVAEWVQGGRVTKLTRV